jgi:hypothetical protein
VRFVAVKASQPSCMTTVVVNVLPPVGLNLAKAEISAKV